MKKKTIREEEILNTIPDIRVEEDSTSGKKRFETVNDVRRGFRKQS